MRYPIIEYVLLTALLMCAALAMVGCAHTKVVVAPQTHSDHRDSVRTEYKHDSIYVDRWHNIITKGDTVRIHDSIYVEKWRVRELHDSVRIEVRDSIPYPVEVQVPVAYKSGYTKFTSWFFWIVLIIAICLGVWKLADYIPILSKYKTAIKLFFKLKK